MSPDSPAGPALDVAAAAVLGATDRTGLARALCEGVATSVAAAKVLLLGADGTEICRDRGDTEKKGPSVPVPERSGGAVSTTTFIVHAGPPEITLVVHEVLDEDEQQICRFLIDLTTAALDRLESRELVADHQERFRRLGDKLRSVGFDSAPESSDDAGASDLAVAASLLTQREREVLELVVAGASNAAIAEKYTLSIETVKTHVKHILRKMGASNRAELIARSM
ncbi:MULTISPECIES: LuxR C-terminal-related transcriptional regulator [Gordonia]|uniref:LuxR C-terminal-related transcriptional regulator n=1 Tax=Gordonia TaxID=2053 RepID=UPI00339690EA